MSGISGIVTVGGGGTCEWDIVAMTKALAHRGPDGEGVYVDGPIGLGHRRLATKGFDKTNDQPMPFADARYRITFDGEIYNCQELKAALEALGHRFRGNSDAEALLAAYVEWGEECQPRLNGKWAFAVWDSVERRLFLSRDRFGVKPLFYYCDGHRLAFASEMKAFLALPWFPATFDPPAVSLSLQDPYALEATEYCLLAGLRRLRAGHSMAFVQSGEMQVRQWWRTLDHLVEPDPDFAQQVEGFLERFEDAVRLRVRDDVPFACTLSGGLDSTSVASTMTRVQRKARIPNRATPQDPTAFVVSFPGTSHDEVHYARELANYIGIPVRVLDVVPSLLPGILDELVFQCEEIQSPHPGPWLLYREMSRAGIRVPLEGHGADELLAGYFDQVSFARDHALFPMPRMKRAAELTAVLRRMTGKTVGPLSLRDWMSAGRRFTRLARSQLAKSIVGSGRRGSRYALPWLRVLPLPVRGQEPGLDKAALSPVTAFLFNDFHQRALPASLRDLDRNSMAHGVEVRLPFLDWRLVCYCLSLPSESVLGGGFTKRILREAMRDRLPETIRTQPRKIPFKTPMAEWWRGPLLELVRDTVNSAAFLANETWDGPGLRDVVERSTAGNRFEGALMVLRFVAAHRLMELFRSARITDLAANRAASVRN